MLRDTQRWNSLKGPLVAGNDIWGMEKTHYYDYYYSGLLLGRTWVSSLCPYPCQDSRARSSSYNLPEMWEIQTNARFSFYLYELFSVSSLNSISPSLWHDQCSVKVTSSSLPPRTGLQRAGMLRALSGQILSISKVAVNSAGWPVPVWNTHTFQK